MLTNVFNASTVCLRELIRVVNNSDASDLLLNVFNCSISQTQSSSSSWWSSTSGGNGGGKTNESTADSNTTDSRRRIQPGVSNLDVWITWINDQAHVNIKNTLRSRVGKLLAPVYKTTESTMKRLIKAAGKMVQKHTDRHNKYKKKEHDDQREQEDKWDRNRTKSTTHLSGRYVIHF